MAKGWLDNYGTKENENNSSVSLPEGFVGMGNNTKGRNYSPAWGGQFQSGGYLKKEIKKTEKDLLKKYVDPSTHRAFERAKQQGINTGIHNGPLDAIRHSSSAAAMSSALPTWTNFIPGVAPLKIAATNIAGIAHELNAPNTWQEHASDLYNNFIGSVAGVLPIPEESKHDLLIQAQKHGVLSDMGDKTPLVKKPGGVKHQMGGYVYPVNYVPQAQNGRATRADSLAVLNSQLNLNKFYDKEVKLKKLIKENKNFKPSVNNEDIKQLNEENLDFYREQIKNRQKPNWDGQGVYDDVYKKYFNLNKGQVSKLEYQGLGQTKSSNSKKAYYRDLVTPQQNLAAPFALIDSRIQPQGYNSYSSTSKKMDYPGGNVDVYDYDPLAVTPFDLLTDDEKELRVKKYGTNGVPKSYLTKIKPTTTKPTTTKPNTTKPNTKSKDREPIEPVASNLQLKGSINNSLNTNLPGIHPQVRPVKDWKYVIKGGGGSEEGYINSPEEMDYYSRQKDFYTTGAGKGLGSVQIIPQYQMGGSLPGATGHMYARYEGGGEIDYPRTKGIPSNGPYAKKTMASAQNGQEMKYYQEGLDFKPKSISKNGGWLDSYEEEEVIKDDMGQWNHPGEITEIGSNDITMEGVPYDVLGISDTGDTKLMKPGKNYKFKGKKVTEYPMAKNGLRQEQKGLENLDQLTNFTNYNKPQPGGWLNKYN